MTSANFGERSQLRDTKLRVTVREECRQGLTKSCRLTNLRLFSISTYQRVSKLLKIVSSTFERDKFQAQYCLVLRMQRLPMESDLILLLGSSNHITIPFMEEGPSHHRQGIGIPYCNSAIDECRKILRNWFQSSALKSVSSSMTAWIPSLNKGSLFGGAFFSPKRASLKGIGLDEHNRLVCPWIYIFPPGEIPLISSRKNFPKHNLNLRTRKITQNILR